MAELVSDYPATLDVDYPDRDLNRLTSFFRPVAVLPILFVLALLGGITVGGDNDNGWELGGAIIVFLPTALMLVFRWKYPRWWFDWNLAVTRFGARVMAYLALMNDVYPSTDEEQSVHIEIPYPKAEEELNRWLPIVKWLLAIPHYIVLFFLGIAAIVAVIIAWFAILFTGRYPRDLFNFVTGVLRWYLRVLAYAYLLTTDRYPPFRLGP